MLGYQQPLLGSCLSTRFRRDWRCADAAYGAGKGLDAVHSDVESSPT